MRKLSVLLFLFSSVLLFSQKKISTNTGVILEEELRMSSYDKDTTASALVLYEHANTYLSQKHNLKFKTDYYFRVKIFDKKAYNKATIKIRLYGDKKIQEIDAFSYNLINDSIQKTQLRQEEIFTKDPYNNWREVVFTIPNIIAGTVIEYKYSTISPYSIIDDWYFQSDIPKLKSDYTISYLGNYKYNIRLIGFLKLDRNEKKVEKKCLYVPRVGRGDCANFSYGINDIPAFKEEKYMLSKENFLSRLSLDLVSIARTDGTVFKYSKTWKDVDISFKRDFLDSQTSKKKFFSKFLPKNLFSINNPLEKATNIYQYIQNRFSWDKRYWSRDKINLQETFQEKTGGVDVINLSLYNSLQAANIESYLVMIASRDQAQPTKLYPVRTDFNYLIVKVVIGGKAYFLDATDKFLFFGQIPLRALNGEGRVLDFKNGSYWQKISPILKNSTKIRVSLKLSEQRKFLGAITVEKNGYHAQDSRKKLSFIKEDEYISNLELHSTDFEIDDFSVRNLDELNEPFFELLKFSSDDLSENTNIIRLTPFYYHVVQENPFKLNNRNYPVDFGYPRSFTYTINIDIPKGYKIKKIPSEVAFKLPNNGGRFVLKVSQLNQKLMIHYRYQIQKKVFNSEGYFSLKEFYNQIIKAQSSYIEFEKQY